MPRVFDCFIFFNEFDLLEIRLHELAPVVDRFVIVEAPLTFTGKPKPLHFKENQARFADFADRIVHVVDNDQPASASAWERQHHQRNALGRGISEAAAEDLIMLSDLDEIPRRETVAYIKEKPPARGEVLCLELRYFNYFMNLECNKTWLRHSPRCVRRDSYFGMQALRHIKAPESSPVRDIFRALSAWREAKRFVRRRTIHDAGWHFSYLGGAAAIQEKLQSIAGGWKISPDFSTAEGIAMRVGNLSSVHDGSPMHLRPIDETFPDYLRANIERYRHLIADEATRMDRISDDRGRAPVLR